MTAQDPFLPAWLKSAQREVRRKGSGSSAFVQCSYDALIERVWAVVTDQKELAKWFGKVSASMTSGANLTFYLGVEVSSEVLEFVPNRKLVFTWTHSGREIDTVEITLLSQDHRTILELEQHSNDETDWWFGAGAGWETALIRLGLVLQDEDPKRISDETFDEVLGPLWLSAGKLSA